MFFRLILLIVVIALIGTASAVPGQQPVQVPVDFNREIRPILAKHCYACHGIDEKKRSAGLRLDVREEAIAARKKRPAAIVPGKAEGSELIQRVISEDVAERMPPHDSGERLTGGQIDLLKRWINQGARYEEHWAFVQRAQVLPPLVNQSNWDRQPLDRFILQQLLQAGLSPSEEADKYSLLRRLSLDLRGLPATLDEIARFERDDSPQAYEKMVDRFLADSAYGERWARVWLDLARYADSAGYGSDPLRHNMWRYRDWVIEAFNKNMPYDQFTMEQLAGDLLPSPTLEQKMATAFHRNTMTNTEGGTDREEFRVAAVKDRINTTMQVWMGLTMGCAQCHSHKYDPISQRDYYAAYAIFNQTADNDQPNEAPTMPAPTTAQLNKNREIDQQIAAIREKMHQPTAELAKEQEAWEAGMASAAPWILLETSRDPKDARTIIGKLAASTWTGLRLESTKTALTDKVMSKLAASYRPLQTRPPAARFVRITLPGKNRILSLAEVEVFQGRENLARLGDASQSSVLFHGGASRAIDGNTSGDYFQSNSVTHTNHETDPWWEVKLPWDTAVDRIVIWNRTGGLEQRLKGATVQLLDVSHSVIREQALSDVPQPLLELDTVGHRLELSKPSIQRTEQGGVADFVFKEPVKIADKDELVLRSQQAPDPHLKVYVTSDANLKKRVSVPAEYQALLEMDRHERTGQDQERLASYYRTVAPSLKPLRDEIARLEKSRPTVTQLPVMVELDAKNRRTTRLLKKGNFLDPGETVEPALPAFFKASSLSGSVNRLQLAKWLLHPDNPLTARVAVNRIWAQLFGTGIVESEEDFGTQGELPSHPELLDWLANQYQHELQWNTKALIKLIVMSATYKQSSKVTTLHLQKDPRNRLLSRGARYRLEAEMVRDQALALAGVLNRKIGGPSVYPKQPDGLWQAAFNGERTWMTSRGEDRFRRGMYTFWRRTIPYPSMAAFDAPSREVCQVKRVRSNTPIQAFVTLNDPVYVEAAQALARRIVRDGGWTARERLRFALKLCLGRPADEKQIAPLLNLFEQERERFAKSPEEARKLATEPLGRLPEGWKAEDLAAWTVIANVLLNLDGVLMKG